MDYKISLFYFVFNIAESLGYEYRTRSHVKTWAGFELNYSNVLGRYGKVRPNVTGLGLVNHELKSTC